MKKVLIYIFLITPFLVSAQIDQNNILVLTTGTTVEMNSTSPLSGAIMYNTDDNQIYKYDGSNWNLIDSQNLTFDAAAKTLTINNGNTIDLSSLIDDQDWVISGNNIYNANSGNVGIGTPTPSEKLDVTGNAHISNAISIGPNGSGSRLSITDDGFFGNMLDIKTDDDTPKGFRLLNATYSNDYSKAFRFYQKNNGQINFSVGNLSNNFFSIYNNPTTNMGGIGIGGNPNDFSLLYLNRGNKNTGTAHYRVQRLYFRRQGVLDDKKSTQGIYNVLYGETTGSESRYYGQQTTVGILDGDFNLAYGDYSYAYSTTSKSNPEADIYGSSNIGYSRGDGNVRTVRGLFSRAAKNLGSGTVKSLIGADLSAIRTDSNFGIVDNAYGSTIQVYGAKENQFGLSITNRTLNANTTNLYGSYARIYATDPWVPTNIFGYYVNSSASTADASNAIYNFRVHSVGHTNLPQNFGNHVLLRGGIDNYGFYADIQNGSGKNYAFYANAGNSFFRDSVGIGVANPETKLHVNGEIKVGAYTLPAIDGTNGQVLKTDGSGILTWSDDIHGTINCDLDETGSGTASSDQQYNASNAAQFAFDNQTTTSGWGNSHSLPTYLKYDFGNGSNKIITKYTLYRNSNQQGGWNSNNYSPSDWEFQGSNDGSTWTTLDTQNGQLISPNAPKQEYSFTNTTAYRYYRINITASYSGLWANITEMELMACDPSGSGSNVSNGKFVDGTDPLDAVYNDGNVGIGTTTPNATLDVNGTLIEGANQSMFGNSPPSGTGQITHDVASFFSSTSNANYIHIKLPYKLNVDNSMYHIKVTGYNYGGGAGSRVVDLTYVGYCYKNGNSLLNTEIINNGGANFSTTQYVGSDKHIYLRLKTTTGNNYYMTLRVDSMFVGNGRVIKPGEVQIISSASATL